MAFVFFLAGFFLFLIASSSPLSPSSQTSCSAESQGAQPYVNNSSAGIHLALHHIRGPCSPVSSPPISTSDILEHDGARIRALNQRLTNVRSKSKSSPRNSTTFLPETVSVPLNPGHSVGIANYVVKLGLGTPPTTFVMVMDTGSSFSWVQCEPCRISCHSQVGPRFNPSASRTYASIGCGTSECSVLQSATLNPPGCTATKRSCIYPPGCTATKNTCTYEASYGDTSYSVGYLSRDTLTISPAQTLPGFVYGCGQDNQGIFGQSAGLVGLARNKLSLLSQVSSRSMGSVFSYCLPTESSTGSLSIGSTGFDPSMYKFTRMYADSRDNSLYFIQMSGVTVGGRAIPVSAAVYASTRMIIDSGTVITRLPPSVYAGLQGSFLRTMGRYRRAAPFSILDTCFVGSAERMVVPDVQLVFEGGAEMRLAAGNLLIDVGDGVTCLAFARTSPGVPLAIIGNRQQQTIKVAYDVAQSRIGFAAAGCR